MKECPTCRGCFPDDVIHCPEDGTATSISIAGEPILDGRYQLEKRLGQGGMGVVYKARHIFLKTAHAIKIILPDLVGNDPNLVTRFRQEALAAAAIRHQNIIAVTDFGVVRGTMPFLVMEFVQGKSLQDIMAEEHAMSPVRAFELMQPICAGIAAAHRQGIVHRDLKPLNVMVCTDLPVSEGVKILDFGLAKIKSGELLGSFIAAQTTGLMGSPFYMAPEQWSDEPPDARADVYSLGVMLFQMLAGEVPFRGSSIPAIMKKHLTEQVPAFISKGISVPPEIEVVVRHALEKEPQDRTPSADEFAKELRAAMSHASAQLSRTGDAPAVDPSKTLVTPPPQSSLPPSSYSSYSSMSRGSTSLHDPMAGTISSASLAEEEQKNLFAQQELRREEEARRKLEREAAAKRKAEEEAKRAEEARLAEAARVKAEEEKRAEELRLQAEAQKRAEEEARAAEQRRIEEQKRRQAQAAQEAEAKRVAEAEERKRAETERLKREEQARLEEQKRAEQARLAEQQRLEEEKRKAEEARKAEAQRQAEEERQRKEQAARETERKRAEEIAAQQAAQQKAAQQKKKDTEVQAPRSATTPLVQPSAAQAHPLGASTVGETSFAGMPKPYSAAVPAIAKKKSSLPIAIAAVLVLLIAGGGVGGYLFMKSRRATTTTTTPPPPEKTVDPLDVPVKADLVEIPGGAFKMGRDDGEKTEGPSHQQTVNAFSMDKTEVSNLEYAQFVKQTGHAPPPQWGGTRPPAGDEQLPVSNVSYEDAVAFADWRSKRDGVTYRLPTEQEWEFAARNGDQENLYPWGNNWEAGRAITQESGAVHPEQVGKNTRGADRWGIQDLMGNVYEWTSTKASLYPGNPLKLPDVQKDWLVIRGGGYGTPSAKVNGTYRDWFSPTYKNPLLGFRLVKVGS